MDELADLRAQITRMSGELAALSQRLAVLEGAPSVLADTSPARGEGAIEASSPISGEVPEGEGAPPAPPRPTFNWEALIGGKAALWIGSAAIFLAMAFGLAYAWDTIPPAARIASGFALSAAFMAASWKLRGRSQSWFPDGLAGAALALAYLDAWTGYSTHHLFGSQVAFGLMAATTLAGIWLAVRFDAMVIAILATLGGFATPLLIAGNGATPGPLFSYIAILDLNVLGAALFKRWPALGWLGLVGTVLLAFGWGWSDHPAPWTWELAGFYTLFFLEFVGAATVYAARRREDVNQHDVLMLVAAACTYGPATYYILQEPLGAAKAGFPLMLAAVCGAIALASRKLAPENRAFRAAATGLGILFATLTLPIQLDASWYAVAWVAEGALLYALGLRLDSALLRRWGYMISAWGAVAALVLIQGERAGIPVFNPRALPLAASALAGMLLLALDDRATRKTPYFLALWVALATFGLAYVEAADVGVGLGVVAAIGGALAGLGRVLARPAMRGAGLALALLAASWMVSIALPLSAAWAVPVVLVAMLVAHLAGRADVGPNLKQVHDLMPIATAAAGVWACSRLIWDHGPPGAVGTVGVTGLWLLWGAGLLGLGLRLQRQDLRQAGLFLFALTAGKVLLVDLAELETPWRILASGGLGAVLIATSWLYGRQTKEPG